MIDIRPVGPADREEVLLHRYKERCAIQSGQLMGSLARGIRQLGIKGTTMEASEDNRLYDLGVRSSLRLG